MTKIPQDSVAPMPASTLLLTVIGDKDTIVKDIDGKRIINETVLVPPENKNLVEVISDDHGSPALKATHFFPAAPGAESGGGMGAKMSGDSEKVGPLRQMIRDRMRKRMEQSASQRNTVSGDAVGSSEASAGSPSELPDPAQDNLEESSAALQAGQPMLDNKNMRGINALDYYCTWKLFDALEDAAFYGKNREYALGNTPKQRYMGKWSDGVPVKELVVQIGKAK